MSLSANSVFEVRTAGNDTNGGGFVTGASGTDYSQQDSKNTVGSDISTTDAVANGTTTITSATANFGTTIIGNIIYLEGGTGALAAGWYQVTARASATSITVDRTVAAGTGITMNIGGALASLGMAGGVGLVSGNIIYIKAGTYSITSASTNISGGCFSSSVLVVIQGYQTTRNDLGTAPLLQASGISTFTLISSTNGDSSLYNIDVDGASLTSSRGIAARGVVYKCSAINCTNNGFFESTSTLFLRCTATGCSTQPAFLNGFCIFCIAYNNTVTGFSQNTASRGYCFCIADSNSGASSDGFFIDGAGDFILGCDAYNNGRDGIRLNEDAVSAINCICETNAGNGIILPAAQDSVLLLNNATFNNSSGGIDVGTGKGVLNIGAVAGSSSFFTDAPNQDFSLNNVANGGALARATGYPGTLPIGGTGYLDIGALQHLEIASGGGTPIFTNLGARRI